MSCAKILPSALPCGDTVQASHHLHLDPRPRLVGDARAFVAGHAPDLPDETEQALLLLTSELVTNAVLHARTPLEVGITVTTGSVVVTVHDLDLTRPEQHPYPAREGGWGLGLVAALAEQWATQADGEGGKTAWFRLPRGDLARTPDGAAQRTTAITSRGSAAR